MLLRNVLRCALVLTVASLTNLSLAQGPGGPGGFFGGGPGGGARAGSAMLLAIPEVQTELKLTDDQKATIKSEGDSIREEVQKVFADFDPAAMADMTDEERTKKRDEIRKKMEDVGTKVEEKMKTILDAKQLERLTELQYQREGGNALLRVDVIKKLSITEEQQEKLKKIRDAALPARGSFGNFRDMSDEERKAAFEKMRTGRDKSQKEMLAVLTDEQAEDWTKMCGKEFKFPPIQPGQFGRRGQGGGPGGPPPGQ